MRNGRTRQLRSMRGSRRRAGGLAGGRWIITAASGGRKAVGGGASDFPFLIFWSREVGPPFGCKWCGVKVLRRLPGHLPRGKLGSGRKALHVPGRLVR